MLQARLLTAAALGALALLAACSDDGGDNDGDGPGATAAAYGEARVEPAEARAGTTITITPAGTIQPICGRHATVHRGPPGGRPVAIAGPVWQLRSDGPELTVPGCLPERSDAPVSFTVTDGLPPGVYVLCVSVDPRPEGCGTVTVTA